MNQAVSVKEKARMLINAIGFGILAFLLMMVFIPKIMGYETFYIQTGSMGTAIPKGSLVFAKQVPFEEIRAGDVLTFHSDDGDEFFTHRVVKVDEKNQMFTTKGDANEANDPSPTSYYFVQGKVSFSIPLIGYVAEFINSTLGKVIIGAVYLAWIAVEIEIYIMKRKAEQEEII